MKLLFVYNANSGQLNSLFDAGHKLISPSTYKCSLCALTHHTFSKKRLWKKFEIDSQVELAFYHKDEFETMFPNLDMRYPTILKYDEHHFSEVFGAEVLNEISNVEDLIERLKLQLSDYVP
ncbi:GTPase [Winogradskyella psychrotolerans]|uniref:GTPase n=1 Tax=Winogradskyella psychrotolerans TaxID=1344585 RepID=UPI001C06CE09|nr:GTPase [Winogradskyella psychrotolerans]MBU2929091.1 GTPase [Winogradskyella psychrotolerans]